MLNINVQCYHKKQEPVSCTVPKFGPGTQNKLEPSLLFQDFQTWTSTNVSRRSKLFLSSSFKTFKLCYSPPRCSLSAVLVVLFRADLETWDLIDDIGMPVKLILEIVFPPAQTTEYMRMFVFPVAQDLIRAIAQLFTIESNHPWMIPKRFNT